MIRVAREILVLVSVIVFAAVVIRDAQLEADGYKSINPAFGLSQLSELK